MTSLLIPFIKRKHNMNTSKELVMEKDMVMLENYDSPYWTNDLPPLPDEEEAKFLQAFEFEPMMDSSEIMRMDSIDLGLQVSEVLQDEDMILPDDIEGCMETKVFCNDSGKELVIRQENPFTGVKTNIGDSSREALTIINQRIKTRRKGIYVPADKCQDFFNNMRDHEAYMKQDLLYKDIQECSLMFNAIIFHLLGYTQDAGVEAKTTKMDDMHHVYVNARTTNLRQLFPQHFAQVIRNMENGKWVFMADSALCLVSHYKQKPGFKTKVPLGFILTVVDFTCTLMYLDFLMRLAEVPVSTTLWTLMESFVQLYTIMSKLASRNVCQTQISIKEGSVLHHKLTKDDKTKTKDGNAHDGDEANKENRPRRPQTRSMTGSQLQTSYLMRDLLPDEKFVLPTIRKLAQLTGDRFIFHACLHHYFWRFLSFDYRKFDRKVFNNSILQIDVQEFVEWMVFLGYIDIQRPGYRNKTR